MLRSIPFLLMAITISGAQVIPPGRTAEGRRRADLPEAAAAQPAGPPASVSGQVVTTAGDPLRKAIVVLYPAGGMREGSVFEATSDAAGRFSLLDVPPGSYTLGVQRNGYLRSGAGSGNGRNVRRRGTLIALDPGQHLTGMTIRMTPQAVITGRVVDEDGDPLARASVQVLVERYVRGRRQWSPAQAAQVNDLGEYRIAGLPAGRYHVAANANRGFFSSSVRRNDGADLRYTAMFYPGVSDAAQAVAVELNPGQEARGIDFQLRKSPTVRIRGRVVDAVTGAGVRGAHVLLTDGMLNISRSMGMARDEEGNFEISGVQPGTYTLTANRSERDEGRFVGQISVQVGSRDLDGIIVPIHRPVEVTGIVRVENQENLPLEGTRVTIEPLQGMTTSHTGPVEKTGAVKVSNVPFGQYRLSVMNGPDGTYLKSVRIGGQEVADSGFGVTAGTTLDIVLGSNAPQVQGTVQDGNQQPAAGATVVLVPAQEKRDRYWLYRTVTADQNGSFSLAGIPPGDYTAIAFSEVEEGAWFNPDLVRQHESRGATLKLVEGARENIRLQAVQ
jgi:protocatechuate 3,4-dioxygenase beta subunit